jgi:hypothetical protein
MNLKSFSIGIIDFLGVMIPGIIWVGIFFSLHALYPDLLSNEYSRISTEVSGIFPESSFAVNTFIFLFCSYLIGYISRLAPPRLLDRITFFLASISTEYTFKEVWKFSWKKKEQPFDFLFEHQSNILKKMFGDCDSFCGKTRNFKMFFLCKRIIHQYSQPLWLEAERMEAEIRLINGLIYPSLFSALFFFFLAKITCGFLLIALSIFLILAFRRRRYAEVSYVLSATFVIIKGPDSTFKKLLHTKKYAKPRRVTS